MNNQHKTQSAKFHSWIAVPIMLMSIYIFSLSWYSPLDYDEAESLYASWLLYSGQSIYSDFFQIHTPLFYYFFTPLFLFIKTFNIYYVARMIIYLFLLLNGYLLFRMTRALFGINAAMFTFLFYLASYPVLEKMIEIRPDILVLIFSNLALMMLLSKNDSAVKSFFAAGMFTALAILSKQSGVVFLIGVVLFFAVRLIICNESLWSNSIFSTKRFNPKCMSFFFLGFVIPLILFILFLYLNGSTKLFVQHAITNDFLRASVLLETTSIHWSPVKNLIRYIKVNFISIFLMFATIYLVIIKGKGDGELKNTFVFICILLIVSFSSLFFILHPHLHELLLLTQYVSILAGLSLAWTFERLYEKMEMKKNLLYPIATVSILLLICYLPMKKACRFSECLFQNNFLAEHVKAFTRVTMMTNEQDKYLSPSYPILFRPSVYFHRVGSLVRESKPSSNKIEKVLIDNILNDNINAIYYIKKITKPMKKLDHLIKKHYKKISTKFYIPGQKLFLQNGKITEIDIIVEGYYTIKNNWRKIYIDNQPMETNSIYLQKGRHTISIKNTSKTVLIIYDLIANKSSNE